MEMSVHSSASSRWPTQTPFEPPPCPGTSACEQRAGASRSEPGCPAPCLNGRPKPRTVSTQFDRLSRSDAWVGWLVLQGAVLAPIRHEHSTRPSVDYGEGRETRAWLAARLVIYSVALTCGAGW